MQLFDYSVLNKLSIEKREEYKSANPFPHIVLDNIANPEDLNIARYYFPKVSDPGWFKYNNVFETKLARNTRLGYYIRNIILELNSSEFISFLENLSGIENLIPDAHLNGGGLHCILPGGKLDVHADYNYHPKTKLDRRLNLLLYLNQSWEENWGGHL